MLNFKGIYAGLSQIWKCRNQRIFGANFLGQKLVGANFTRFCNYAYKLSNIVQIIGSKFSWITRPPKIGLSTQIVILKGIMGELLRIVINGIPQKQVSNTFLSTKSTLNL